MYESLGMGGKKSYLGRGVDWSLVSQLSYLCIKLKCTYEEISSARDVGCGQRKNVVCVL